MFDEVELLLYHLAVMLERLPKLIDPVIFAESKRELSGTIELHSLARLKALLLEDAGSVELHLSFIKDGRLATIKGTVKATLMLSCQNCLEAIEVSVEVEFLLAVVRSVDEVNRLPERYEPLLIEENIISLNTIIEEELLLAIPAFPKHAYACFQSQVFTNDDESLEQAEQSASDNPFAILSKLKNTGD